MRSIDFNPSSRTLTAPGVWCLLAALVYGTEKPDFNRDVRPILANHCLRCHGPDHRQRKTELRFDAPASLFDDRGGYRVINRKQPENSELLVRINSRDDDLRMPPRDSPSQPTSEEIDILRRWIVSGANWTAHWAFVPPQRPIVPVVRPVSEVENEIDSFIVSKLRQKDLHPSTQANRSTLIRRVTLALTGLPPTPDDVDAFLQDESPDAYERLVDRLLSSRAYGEHMAIGWLDAARYADSAGYQADWERFMWPWRDWVIQAFNDNMPFDQFTIEQLAGDMLPDATMSQQLATGFNRNHRINDEGGSLDAEFEVEYVVDRVDTTATVWLGLTAGCARCHDHKYDPLSQREFYQLYAYFNNVPEKGIDGRKGAARPFINVPNQHTERQLNELNAELDKLKSDGTDHTTRIRQIEEQSKLLRKNVTTPVMVMQEQAPREPAYLLKRGAYDHPDKSEVIPPALPKVFQSLTDATPGDRLQLAHWIVSPQNPLTARVIINRLWQHHFGSGLVKTSEDFGTRGEPASHPNLLDWLATEFVRTGWDIKAMHRRIVTSSTFRQVSTQTPAQRQRDPGNRLLSRGPRLRLTGAAIRDQAMAISGLMTPVIGGPPVKPYQPEGLWKELSFGTGKTTIDFYVQDHGQNLYRRSVYTFWKRTVAPPRMAVFDGGSRAMCRVRSESTNTPLQALTLQNDVTFVEASRHLAERMLKAGASNSSKGLELGWRLAMTRRPSPDELNVLELALNRNIRIFRANPEQADQLLSNGESQVNHELDPPVHAAWTIVALSILNLDETITRE
ncbi:MAG: PSD1 and planctomycete cytochrome C domain-containing protein [Fuerstiella sp.]|nr:PSD1 and planctomycete cytochrome C domain-containing protein [Fuerstiella sp.]